MTVEEKASKIITDSEFSLIVKGKEIKYKVPTKYYQNRIQGLISSMDFDLTKLNGNTKDATAYAMMLNGKYGLVMCDIVALILYGRNMFYDKPFLHKLSEKYIKYKAERIKKQWGNNEILEVFINYIGIIGLSDFIHTMRFIEAMK